MYMIEYIAVYYIIRGQDVDRPCVCSLSERRIEKQILLEHRERLQGQNNELNRTAERLSLRMSVSRIVYFYLTLMLLVDILINTK